MNVPFWFLHPWRAYMQWRERNRARYELLKMPHVDWLVVYVMDRRYGKHEWRVRENMLEAQVMMPGTANPWWGLIGKLDSIETRAWLYGTWAEMTGTKVEKQTPTNSLDLSGNICHACGRIGGGHDTDCVFLHYYRDSYADTQPEGGSNERG